LTVKVNTVGQPASRRAYGEKLRELLAPHAQRLSEDSRRRLEQNPLRVLDTKDEGDQKLLHELSAKLPRMLDVVDADDRAHWDAVLAGLADAGIAFELDHGLVRGLDYYTRTAFEVHYAPLGSQSALGGGGRYDGLIEACGGPPTPAVGFSAGIERILYALQDSAAAPPAAADAAVVVLPLGASARVEALRLARRLRSVAAARVDLTGRSLKAQLRTAGRDARVAVILGDHELQKREASVRDLVRGEQRSVGLDELLDVVKRTLATTAGRSPE
jgi:histidyl-tRNA synthetase